MALTGLTWSFRWYRTGFYALFGASTEQPKQSAPAHEDNNKKEKKNEPERLNYLAWDAALAELQNRYETYGTIQLSKNSAQVIQSGKQKGDTRRQLPLRCLIFQSLSARAFFRFLAS